MQPVEVTARFDLEGQATPLSFVWQGRSYPVDSTGRRWQDALGQHILVMVPGDRVYELILAVGEIRWYLRDVGFDRRAV